MGLSNALARYATRRAHVFIAETPGSWMVRARLERDLIERGWRLGPTPADADVLAVCGVPGPELTSVIDRLWDQMPGPRVRTDLDDTTDIARAMDAVAGQLTDTESHRKDAAYRNHEPQATSDENAMGHGDMDHGDMDHGDMDHRDMEMAPDGIPLAEGEDDRDGLEMDVLRLRLGPVLPCWPAGLVLSCTVNGDVISRADGSMIDAPDNAALNISQASSPAWRADNIARFLTLAGCEDTAALAGQVRDGQLTSYSAPEIGASLERLRRQVNRSRLLRWSLQGLGPLTPEDLDKHDLPRHLKGDTWDRLMVMLDRAVAAADAAGAADSNLAKAPKVSPGAAAAVAVGLDLAAARLVIASLDMPPSLVPSAATHG